MVSYGKCFGREDLRTRGERGARLVQTGFIGDRRSLRGWESPLSDAKRIEPARFSDRRRYESCQRAIRTRQVMIVLGDGRAALRRRSIKLIFGRWLAARLLFVTELPRSRI